MATKVVTNQFLEKQGGAPVKYTGVIPDCEGLTAGFVPHSLCDLKQVTQILCASVSSALKWVQESFYHLPRHVVKIK